MASNQTQNDTDRNSLGDGDRKPTKSSFAKVVPVK